MTRKVSDDRGEPKKHQRVRSRHRLTATALGLLAAAACGNQAELARDGTKSLTTGAGAATGMGGTNAAGSGGSAAEATGGTDTGAGGSGAMGGTITIDPTKGQPMMSDCTPTTCAEQGYGCGWIVDECGNKTNCADEGLTCGPLEACVGGLDAPATCMVGGGEPCELCPAVQDCTATGVLTSITGRVVTPGRTDDNVSNQVGVPNAFVYILRNKGVDDLPAIGSGIPDGGTSCDRCEDQDLGPVLVGTVTDATGAFKLEGNVPVGDEFTLVVKAGRFRRAFAYTLPMEAACTATVLPSTLPGNPTRLPRNMQDGLAVNIPRMAVSTGSIDAMECVLEKMGLAHEEFGNPGAAGDAAPRVHIYQGRSNADVTKGDGVSIDTSTPLEDVLYGDPKRLKSYDVVLADCEGQYADSTAGTRMGGPPGMGGMGGMGGMATTGGPQTQYQERDEFGANVIDYVNRGGRMFASHLRYSWLYENGAQAYDAADPYTTGLDAAATWEFGQKQNVTEGDGVISLTRPLASPRIQAFADWMSNEGVATAPDYGFQIKEPRSQVDGIGMSSEEFVYTSALTDNGMVKTGDKIQQFSFNTPYAAPTEAVCGRVAYSGFHVSIGDTSGKTFPSVCTGDLTDQEKVLLYMLFDLATCVGDTPPPPICVPTTCEALDLECGFASDGCGDVLDCGPCLVKGPR